MTAAEYRSPFEPTKTPHFSLGRAMRFFVRILWENQSHYNYRKTSNISHTLVGYKIVDHSDVVGASPVGAAPTTSSFST